jgi:aryl sulfotransferase
VAQNIRLARTGQIRGPMSDMRKIGNSLFRELSECDEHALGVLLSAAGFGDINLNEVLVLHALQMNGNPAMGPRREPKFSHALPHEMIDKLSLRGYLENKDPDYTVTSRGHRVVEAAMAGAMADRRASFSFRPGDIVISTPPKSGTTWMQMICALLIFRTPGLPASLDDLSPWLDDPMAVRHEVFERYSVQRHRRFIKTHTPLADLPIDPQVTYVVVGRNPLDVGVSRYHQFLPPKGRPKDNRSDLTPQEWLLKWIGEEPPSPLPPPSLLTALRHMSDAWARRDAPNIVLTHYEDLSADLAGQMRYLATRLGITVPEELWPGLVRAATFEQMRAAADRIQPLGDKLNDHTVFFRKGTSGAGVELLTPAQLASYHARVAQVLEPDVLAWLHRDYRA